MEAKFINHKNISLKAELQAATEDKIVVRAAYVNMGWGDVLFYGHYYGFHVARLTTYEGLPEYGYNECYEFTRK